MSSINEQIDALFAAWDGTTTPGCVLAIIQRGEMVYQRAYGMADLERSVPLRTDSVFDIGSIGKQFTAALMGLLAQEGRLSLDDTLQQHIPEMPDYSREITIGHLIHHTSGLRDYVTLMELTNRGEQNEYFEDELLDLMVRQQELNFPPGSEYLYSNAGYFLLGVIAKRVTGKPYLELIRAYILQPLCMTHTDFNDNFRRIIPNRALAYDPRPGGGYDNNISFLGGYGDGAILSNVGDLLLWDRNFYHNQLGNRQAEFITMMETPGLFNDGTASDYGFGLRVSEHNGLRTVGHGGAWAGYRSAMVRFPDQQVTIICLANLANDVNPSGKVLQVADIFLAAEMAEKGAKATLSSDTPEDFAREAETVSGIYRSANGGTMLEVAHDAAGWLVKGMGIEFRMEAAGADRLKSVDAPFEIEVAFPEADRLTLSIEGDKPMPYQKLAAPADVPQDHAGAYYSTELDILYRIVQDGEGLAIKRGYAPQEALKVISIDLYATDQLIFQFYRDAEGKIDGFDLFAGRVVNLRFGRRE